MDREFNYWLSKAKVLNDLCPLGSVATLSKFDLLNSGLNEHEIRKMVEWTVLVHSKRNVYTYER